MQPPSNIEATLAERGNRYGVFAEHARITQSIKLAMYDSKNWDHLAPDQAECLEMLAHKIGRILNGDPDYHDSWHDIVGYTKLVADRLQQPSQENTPPESVPVHRLVGRIFDITATKDECMRVDIHRENIALQNQFDKLPVVAKALWRSSRLSSRAECYSVKNGVVTPRHGKTVKDLISSIVNKYEIKTQTVVEMIGSHLCNLDILVGDYPPNPAITAPLSGGPVDPVVGGPK